MFLFFTTPTTVSFVLCFIFIFLSNLRVYFFVAFILFCFWLLCFIGFVLLTRLIWRMRPINCRLVVWSAIQPAKVAAKIKASMIRLKIWSDFVGYLRATKWTSQSGSNNNADDDDWRRRGVVPWRWQQLALKSAAGKRVGGKKKFENKVRKKAKINYRALLCRVFHFFGIYLHYLQQLLSCVSPLQYVFPTGLARQLICCQLQVHYTLKLICALVYFCYFCFV